MWVKGFCVIEIIFYRNLNLKAEIRVSLLQIRIYDLSPYASLPMPVRQMQIHQYQSALGELPNQVRYNHASLPNYSPCR